MSDIQNPVGGTPYSITLGSTLLLECLDYTPPQQKDAKMQYVPKSGSSANMPVVAAGSITDWGEAACKVAYDASQDTTLRALVKVPTTISVVMADGTIKVYPGFIQDLHDDQFMTDQVLSTSFQIVRTGPDTVTPAAAGQLYAEFDLALSSGAAVLNLTSLPDPIRGTVNGTGKKVNRYAFASKAANSAAITVTPDAGSNPYNLGGAGTSIVLNPGESVGPETLGSTEPVIGTGAKNMTVSGTGSDVLHVRLWMA